MANEQGPVERNSSNGGGGAGDGGTLTLNGVPYLRGFGGHAPSALEFRPNGSCQTFTAEVGVDDEVGTLGSVLFQVWGDGQNLYEGGVMTGETPTENVNVSIAGVRSLRLQIVSVDSTADDHADWANPRIACADRSPPNQPPQARFTTTRSLVAPWEIVAFDAESSTDPDGTIVSYMWDFGDGFTANGILVRHAYVHSGRFSVVLTVVDNSQTSTTATSEMTVDVPPIAAFSTSLNTAPPGLPLLVDGLSVGGSSSAYVFHGSSVGTHVVRVLVSDGRAEASFAWTIEVRTRPQPPTGHLEPVGAGLFVQVLSASALVALGVILLIQNLRRRRP